jgi:AraC-like DNA-binding protein
MISEGVLLFIAGIGILQAFMLAAILYFHPKSEQSVATFLAIYIIFISLPMFMPVVQHFFPWQLVSIVEPVTLLIGPMLYLFVCSYRETITFRKAWPHFILFVISLFVGIVMYVKLSMKYPASHSIPPEVLVGPVSLIRATVRILQMAFYYVLARRALHIYQRSIQYLYSDISRIDLTWVRYLITGYLVLFLIGLIMYGFIVAYPQHFTLIILCNMAMVTPYIYLVTFRGMIQPTLWQLHPEYGKAKVQQELHDVGEILIHQENEKPRSGKNTVSKDKTDEIVSGTLRVMEQEKLYQEPELSLQDLADKLNQPSYLVSQAINEGLNKSFYDLVNGYRVEAAKRMLKNPNHQQYKILSVGFEAGFNSKTTFNTVFKKFTGLSPSEYRQSV